MNHKELFDVLDPEKWETRPLRKIFLMHNFELEKSTQEEIRQTLFGKIAKWAGPHLDKLDIMSIYRCTEKDGETDVPAIEVNFRVKEQ